MRSTSAVAILFAASALAAPVAREQLDARQGRLGQAANIAGLANAGLFGLNFLSDLFGGGEAAKRDVAEFQDLLARQGRLGQAANIAGLANAGLFGLNFLSDLFGGGDAAAKRDLAEVQDLFARQGRLGQAANIAGLANAGLFGLNFLSDLFGGGDEAAAKRELIQSEINDLVARQGRLGNAANAATIGVGALTLLNGLGSLFGLGEEAAPAARELMAELHARDLEVRQGRLGNAANIAGLGLGLTGILSQLGNLFGGGDEAAAKRELFTSELEELVARQAAASRLGTAANIAGLGLGLNGIINGLGQLFGRDMAEEMAFVSRDLDTRQAAASRLGTAANIAGLGLGLNGIFNGLSSLFGREAAEEMIYMARRDISSSSMAALD